MHKLVLGGILATVLATTANAAVEARTAHFRVVTTLEPEIARAAAEHLETSRIRYETLGLPRARLRSEPLPVILVRDLLELAPYNPVQGSRVSRGLSLFGTDRDFIVLAWEAPGNPRVALAHEYVHHLFSALVYPPWFREGLAEYLSRVEVYEGHMQLGLLAPGHLATLQTQPWIPLADLLAASQHSAVFGRGNFYAQCWLLIHWGVAARGEWTRLDPGELEREIQARDPDAVETELRSYAEGQLPVFPGPVASEAPGKSPVVSGELEAWEWPYLLAELHRELRHWGRARGALQCLEAEFPARPEPSESLGALEMDVGRYEKAEKKLRAAMAKGSRNPRTHYRYSLMLMRPVEGPNPERAWRAIEQARRARSSEPWEPLYVLTEAQGHMLAAQWNEAAELLLQLAAKPAWRERAEGEFRQLQRRRQQQLTRSGAPDLVALLEPPPHLEFLHPLLKKVPKSRPRPPLRVRPMKWPPPGAIILYGRISSVECRDEEKIVTVQTPRFHVRLREPRNAPAKLYHPPLKWQKLPCGTRGWQVNVAYRAISGDPEVHGELVAILF